jgi:hypothetical protein
MEQNKGEDLWPASIDDADMISPRPTTEFKDLKDLTTRGKMLDEGPIDSFEVDTNAEHSFDEDETFSASPDRKAELAQLGTKI